MRRLKKRKKIDDKIALGVLLGGIGAVAEADDNFLPEENKKIKEILHSHLKIREEDSPVVLTAIRQAAIGKINTYRFAREISKGISYNTKISLMKNLFRVAYADRDLNNAEFEIIKKIASSLELSQGDLIDTKAKIKKELGL